MCCLSASPHPVLATFSFWLVSNIFCPGRPPRWLLQGPCLQCGRRMLAPLPKPPPLQVQEAVGFLWPYVSRVHSAQTASHSPTHKEASCNQPVQIWAPEKSPMSTNAHTPLEPKVGWSAKAYAQPRLARQQEDTQTPCEVCPRQGTGRVPSPPSTWGRAGSRSRPGTHWAPALLPPSGLHVSPGIEVGWSSRLACFTLVTDLPGLRS